MLGKDKLYDNIFVKFLSVSLKLLRKLPTITLPIFGLITEQGVERELLQFRVLSADDVRSQRVAALVGPSRKIRSPLGDRPHSVHRLGTAL